MTVHTAPTRMSRQRRDVLSNLEEHRVFRSAQSIHASLGADGSGTGLATVYRNLQLLERMGKVDAVRGEGGEMLYRACDGTSHHHHLICKSCGRAEEVELEGLEQILDEVAESSGYQLLDHTVELVGLCSDCAAKEEVEK